MHLKSYLSSFLATTPPLYNSLKTTQIDVTMEQDLIDEDAMAAMMGFGSFGGTKKRKLDLVSVDTAPAAGPAHSPPQEKQQTMPDANHKQLTNSQKPADNHRRGNNGIRNEKGDMAYFLPSFIEDPWADLLKKRAEKHSSGPT